MTISLVLADDHPVVRQGLRALLEAQPDFAVVGESGDGLETLRLVERLKADVLVLDLMMPGLNGLEILSILAKRSPRTRVVVLSMSAEEAFVAAALKNGAIGYVSKGCETANLIRGVREAAAGRRFLSPEVVAREPAPTAPIDPHETLTPREREVLQLAAEGNTNAAIAARLFLSPRTVEMHRAHLMRKLGLKTPADLIRYALRRGVIPLRE